MKTSLTSPITASQEKNPAIDLNRVRYCEQHETHWVPWDGASERGASCPWCQRDEYWDELEDIWEVFTAAIESSHSQPSHHLRPNYSGDFSNPSQEVLASMKTFVKRWSQKLGKNVRRGS